MTSSNNNRRHRRRNYTSVASEDDQEETDTFRDEPIADESSNADAVAEVADDDEQDEDLPLSLVILDSAQKRFPIPCNKSWTIGTFKKRSAKIHKVAPAQQRLIFRGKMLTNDDQTLEENKLDTNDLIVHLFPKPRVVVTASKTVSNEETQTMNHNDDDGDSGIVDDDQNGAHIPSIVIDQEEQDRRGQILVLGSVEIAESQNNVKMLSLLLVMICAMRLLALFSIAMGAVDEPAPYNSYHNHTGNLPNSDFNDDNIVQEFETREWETQDWYDLLVSGIGFYVGTLGMKATTENTSLLATWYAIGTILAGIGWNLWNVFEYYKFYEEQLDRQQHNEPDVDGDPPLTRDDLITVAFFTIAMPLFVWFMCCVRAFEFRRLILEAEEEAAERIRNEYLENNNASSEEADEPASHEIV